MTWKIKLMFQNRQPAPKTLDGERRNPSFSGLPTDDAPTFGSSTDLTPFGVWPGSAREKSRLRPSHGMGHYINVPMFHITQT